MLFAKLQPSTALRLENYTDIDQFHVSGIDTLVPFLKTVIADSEYRAGAVNTRWLEKKLEQYSANQMG